MSQIVPGLLLGQDTYILRGPFDPNIATTGLYVEQRHDGGNVVALGSLFLRNDTGVVYIKTGLISATAPAGTWQTINVT